MANSTTLVSDGITALADHHKVHSRSVSLSPALVGLLSEQLYRSPVKALEELVVNSFDAEANSCRLYVPQPTEMVSQSKSAVIAVWDDGFGMDVAGLTELWAIGDSRKRDPDFITEKQIKRKQIGKFGIGKLATYAVCERVTYLSSTASGLFAVTIDYNAFAKASKGTVQDVPLSIVKVPTISDSGFESAINALTDKLGIDSQSLNEPGWTLVLLEKLRRKAQDITQGRLRWVLGTAMPLQADFALYLNRTEILSSKEEYETAINFAIHDLPKQRLKSLTEETGEAWTIKDSILLCETLPKGVGGTVRVYKRPLTGKSDDIIRSHGFFIRVNGRLINEDDPLFGLDPLSHKTFYRFRADLDVNDLDAVLLSSREEVGASDQKRVLDAVMRCVFNEARTQFENSDGKLFGENEHVRESDRLFVAPHLVERPLADVLTPNASAAETSDAGVSWFYLDAATDEDLSEIIGRLYSGERSKYRYDFETRGPNDRLVRFEPKTNRFVLNDSHEFIRAHAEDAGSLRTLKDLVTADMLLEVYMRESGVRSEVIGEILENRDALLRALARDHGFSLASIAGGLRDAAANERDLEVYLVRAVRALGFNAQHVSGAEEPDGVARFISYPEGERKFILEAKSSTKVPSLGAIDFGGLRQHAKDNKCERCLLVAPDYPGGSKQDDAQAAKRADELKVSCWTVENLARVVESAERRHINARDIYKIVDTAFSPDSVCAAVEDLLSDPGGDLSSLYSAIITVLRGLEGKLPDSTRTVSQIAGKVVDIKGFEGVNEDKIRHAIAQMAGASRGALHLSDEDAVINSTSLNELENRLSSHLTEGGNGRSEGLFMESNGTDKG
ncbi:ATP-binding protein [Mucisphaera calidilacus]|uniref:Uncharacterized protein n=1 Tax=Mucisphaera calidilacus TaxID=2527982 RepID=A0A518BUV0_9BACT|nr:ATP-binding protein [Mucisphaera calidilacus]QDU70765.1 hypothetical protein Pan265_06010 [Mucisphaera calidilacus]